MVSVPVCFGQADTFVHLVGVCFWLFVPVLQHPCLPPNQAEVAGFSVGLTVPVFSHLHCFYLVVGGCSVWHLIAVCRVM